MSSFVSTIRKSNKEKQNKLFQKLQGQEKLLLDDPAVNWVSGGLARGRANLFWGIRGSGKSTMALLAAGKEQQLVLERMKSLGVSDENDDGVKRALILIYDSEGSYKDPNATDDMGKYTDEAKRARERYAKAGVDPDRVIILQSNKVQELFRGTANLEKDVMADQFLIAAIIVDSWGAIQSEQARGKLLDNKADEAGNSYGGNSKTIGVIVSWLLGLCVDNGITTFWVQHCIDNLEYANNPSLPKYKLVGGNKLQLLVNCMLYLESSIAKDSHLLDGNIISEKHADAVFQVGKKILLRCDKSRFVPEGRKCDCYMNFNTLQFATPERSLFNLAQNLGLFETKGAWLYYPKGHPEPGKWNGGEKMVQSLRDNQDLYNRVMKDCYDTSYTDALGSDTMSLVVLEKDGEKDD